MSDLLNRIGKLSPKRLALLAIELDAKVQELERERTEAVAVIGMACRIPGGAGSPLEYWNLLRRGGDAVVEVPSDRWNIEEYFDADPDAPGRMSSRWGGFLSGLDQFDAPFFGISRREAVSMDPQQRLLLEVCWEALETAGLSPHKMHGKPVGVFVGMSSGDYCNMLLGRGQQAIDAYLATGVAHSVASGRVSYTLGLQGPNYPVDSACSSSLVGVHIAVQSLRNRECSMALTGGVNVVLSPDISIGLSKSHMFAPDGRCKAFDSRADGFVRGEGCGIVVLKRLSEAVADGDNILAVIRGSAVNQDGRSSGLTAPNGPAQEAVIRQALSNARLEPLDIDYVEAHGTGTSLGDPIEAHALAAALGKGRTSDHPLIVGSAKTNLGHLEAAAGIAGLIKVVLSMQNEWIPAHLHFQQMNPHIDWKGVPVEIPVSGKPWKRSDRPRRAGVSSFGFSGTNAHVILEEAPARVEAKASEPERRVQVLAVTARTETALRALEQRYAEHIGTTDLKDFCYTANTGRAHLAERAVYIAANAEEMRTRLREGRAMARGRADGEPEVAFLFTGQGAQYAGMGRQLYESEAVFRCAMDECAAALAGELEPGLIDLIYGQSTELLDDTRYTQPALFALQYSLAQLWRSWGVEPSVVLGHSVGEYAAACVGGFYPVEQGIRLIAARGRMTGALPKGEGAMTAILAAEEEVRAAVSSVSKWVSVAACNGPENLVISGRKAEVERISEQFASVGARVERLRVSHAFHSPMMDPLKGAFEQRVAEVRFRAPQVAMVSTVTGAAVGLAEVERPEYWSRQMCGEVRFHQAIQELAKQGCKVFIEIGAGSTLLGMGKESIGRDEQLWMPSIRRSRSDQEQLAEDLAQLYVRGIEPDWNAYQEGRGAHRISLPTYPFERQRYWLDTETATKRPSVKGGFLGVRANTALPMYDGVIDLATSAWIADHRLAGTPLVPAAAYLDIALAAAKDCLFLRKPAVALLELSEPLRIEPPNDLHEVQTVLVPGPNDTAEFRIFGRSDSTDSWMLHASGTLAEAVPVVGEKIDDVRARTSKSVAPQVFYESLAARGIDLGKAGRNVQQLWAGDLEAVAEVAANDPLTLLDSCFQTLGAALLFGQKSDLADTYVLREIKNFHKARELPGRVFAHARILPVEADSRAIEAELRIYGANGDLLAYATGVEMAPISLAAAASSSADWFYQVEWREQPLVPAPGTIASESNGLRSLRSEAHRLAIQTQLDRYKLLRPELDRLSSAHIVAAFSAAGIKFEPGTILETSLVRVVARHAPLFARMLAILAEDGVLGATEGGWQVLHHPEDLDTNQSLLNREFPAWNAELLLLRRCGSRLLEVLRGESDPLQLLTPDGSFETLEQLYNHSPSAQVFNSIARKVMEATGKSAGLRVLEIGAGTGGTTAYLAPALAGRVAEYVYTDISPLFLARAEERLRQFSFFRFATLDIEQKPASQGFADGQFDVIVAANVLHATADLRSTVERVRKLLRPSGLLILIEGTQPERWVDLTFGLTEGWWKFQDTDLRPNYALLDRDSWIALLKEQGFASASAVEPFESSQQVLLLAAASAAPDSKREILIVDATRAANASELIAAIQKTAQSTTPKRVWLATCGAHALAATSPVSAKMAALWGIARTASLEYPDLWGGVVDVDAPEDAASAVASEAASGSAEDQVLYRNGQRFVPRIVRQSIAPGAPALDADGSYLITGGLGNLGIKTAEWLVAHGARNLVLTGRTASRSSGAVATLERLGATVHVVAADIATGSGLDALRKVMGSLRPLRGIVHTAAVFDRTLLSELTPGGFDAVFHPKAIGAQRLLELCEGAPLDFLVLFSSTTALLGVRGMAAYAAANAYLDAFAHSARQRGIPAVSINWGTWEEMGRTSAEDRESYLRAGLQPMSSRDALDALGAVLHAGKTQATIASIQWETLRSVYEVRRRRPLLDAVTDKARKTPRLANHSKTTTREDLRTRLDHTAPADRLQLVIEVVCQEAATVLALRPGELETGLGLFEMGMDSLMSVELRRRLELCCGKTLPSTLTFNYPSIRALAKYLYGLLLPELAANEAAPEPNPEPLRDERDELSEDELAELLSQALKT